MRSINLVPCVHLSLGGVPLDRGLERKPPRAEPARPRPAAAVQPIGTAGLAPNPGRPGLTGRGQCQEPAPGFTDQPVRVERRGAELASNAVVRL